MSSLAAYLLHFFISYPSLIFNTQTRNWSTDADHGEANNMCCLLLSHAWFLGVLSLIKSDGKNDRIILWHAENILLGKGQYHQTCLFWSLQRWKMWPVSLCHLQDGIKNSQQVLTALKDSGQRITLAPFCK